MFNFKYLYCSMSWAWSLMSASLSSSLASRASRAAILRSISLVLRSRSALRFVTVAAEAQFAGSGKDCSEFHEDNVLATGDVEREHVVANGSLKGS